MINKLPPYFEQYLDQKFGEVNKNITKLSDSISSVEYRVSTIEGWKENLAGRLTVITTIAFIGFNLIADWVKKKFDL